MINNLIDGKRVVIVGPAPYLKNKKIGDYIDSFDTIIRVNRGHSLINDSINYGSRTDILYHCMSQNIEDGGPFTDEILNDVKYIIGSIPPIYPDEESTLKGGTIHSYKVLTSRVMSKLLPINKQWYLNLEKRFETRPNTGVTMIFDILENYKPEFVYITGFTMFKDGYSKDYRDKIDGKLVDEETGGKDLVLSRMNKSKNHNQYKIWNNFKNILKHNNIKIDKELFDILNMDLDNYISLNNLGNISDEKAFYHFLNN